MPKRVDDNQAEIVGALRRVGCSVQTLHEVGRGVPDLLVGTTRACPCCGMARRVNLLMEVKDGQKPASQRSLTPAEAEWHVGWRGVVHVVESVEDALRAVGLLV